MFPRANNNKRGGNNNNLTTPLFLDGDGSWCCDVTYFINKNDG